MEWSCTTMQLPSFVGFFLLFFAFLILRIFVFLFSRGWVLGFFLLVLQPTSSLLIHNLSLGQKREGVKEYSPNFRLLALGSIHCDFGLNGCFLPCLLLLRKWCVIHRHLAKAYCFRVKFNVTYNMYTVKMLICSC